LGARGTIVFSQPLNWDLTADVTAGPWKGRKMNIGSDKEVSVFQGHRRERDLFEGLEGNFLIMLSMRTVRKLSYTSKFLVLNYVRRS